MAWKMLLSASQAACINAVLKLSLKLYRGCTGVVEGLHRGYNIGIRESTPNNGESTGKENGKQHGNWYDIGIRV